MRLRRKPWIDEAIKDYSDFLHLESCESYKGKWRSLFKNPDAPLWVELGTGKGNFISQMAQIHKDVNFIGIEIQVGVLYYAGKKCAAAEVDNVQLLRFDVARLEDIFAPGEVDRFFINFCDPWPSKRHAKRRLTHGNFLKLYRQVLKMGGQIHFKTDNQPLFEFSVEELPQFGFELSEVTRNLHENGPVGVMTDYEAKFHELGQPINRCVGTMVDWEEPEVPEDAEPAEETVEE